MKKNYVFSIIILMVMAICQQGWSGTTIGVNFCDEWEAPHIAGELVDGFDNWTDSVPVGATGQQAGSVVLLGSNDNVTCSWSSSNTWAGGDENTSEQQLYRVYLDDTDNAINIAIDGIGDWMASEGLGGYVIRVYHSTDNGAGFSPVDIFSGDVLQQTIQETNHWTNDGGIRAYVDSDLLTADSLVIDPQDRTGNNGGDLRACISGIKIVGVDLFQPVTPDPGIGEEVVIDKVLSWEQLPEVAGLGVTYNVYFGTEPNELSPEYYGNTPVKTSSSDPIDFFYDHAIDLENSTTYYWRVDAIEPTAGDDIIHDGAEWSFITQPASARIETDPASQTVAAGTAEVHLEVAAINAETYQWYKDGTPLVDDPTDTMYSGENGPVLTIYDVQLDDESYYYCQVDNSLVSPADSQPARLLTERLMGWWELNGDLTDSVNNVISGVPAHDGTTVDPNYVTSGISGSAMEFFGTPEDIVDITDSGEYFNFYPQGYTVSAWVNISEYTGSWAGYVSKESILENSSTGFVLTSTNNGEAIHTLRESFNDLGSGVNVIGGEWHLVIGTYDAESKQGKVYVDGVLANETVNTAIVNPGPANLMFGAQNENNDSPFVGLLDDVRVWSYPIGAVDVAMLYINEYPGTEICVEYSEFDIAGPDGVGDEFRDCKVNLYDFVPMMNSWLECNIVPTCID